MEKMILDHYFDQSILDKMKTIEDRLTHLDRNINEKIDKIMTLIEDNNNKQIMNHNILVKNIGTAMDNILDTIDQNHEKNIDIKDVLSKYNDMVTYNIARIYSQQIDDHNKSIKELVMDMDTRQTTNHNVLLDSINNLEGKK